MGPLRRLRRKAGECGPPPVASTVRQAFATEKLVVDADADLRAQIERAVQKAGYTCAAKIRATPALPNLVF